MNYYDFLHKEQDRFSARIEDFFEDKLRDTFPEENFVFDVYIPEPHNKVWLIDINPWAQRTDPLLFSWLELLTMEVPPDLPTESLRLRFADASIADVDGTVAGSKESTEALEDGNEDSESDDDESLENVFVPEFRLLNRDDPEAYGFASAQYSAHKMPKDVVDAATFGNTNALRELSEEWKEALNKTKRADAEYESSGED
jgi:hypothetical protein